MESFTFPSFPQSHSTIHLLLFKNVTNSPQIRKRLITASTLSGAEGDRAREEVDFGFVEGRLIVSREHLLTAIISTLLTSFPSLPSLPNSETSLPESEPTQQAPKTRSHNLHSELLLSLSSNNNISESIRRHGLSDNTDVLVVARFTGPEERREDVWKGMNAVVEGEIGGLDELGMEGVIDWGRIDKTYKLSELSALPLPAHEIQQRKRTAVISTVAVKSVT